MRIFIGDLSTQGINPLFYCAFSFKTKTAKKYKEKTMFSKLKSIRVAALVGIFVIFNLVSCTQDREDNEAAIDPENAEAVNIQEDNFTESDEDLLTVDYKQFYNELSPHGEWIEVTPDKIGVDLNTGSASGSVKHKKMSLSTFLGVSDAYAQDISMGAFFVWQPSPNLAVGVTTGSQPQPVYTPYTNGQWLNTNQGWYFQAATPHEEIVHHYGRWTYSPAVGWVWVPGRVWSPAWVDWREDDSYIGWSPLPPGVYIVDDRVMDPGIYDDRYVVVERRYFVEPEIYKYHVVQNKNKVIIHEMRKVDGVMVVDHRVINRGPQVSVIESVLGTQIPVYDVNKVSVLTETGYNGNVINTYYPGFKEFKVVQTIESPVRKPVDFVTFEKVKDNKNYSKTPPGLQKKSDNNDSKVIDRTLGNDKNNGNKNVKKNNGNKNKGNNNKFNNGNKNKKRGNDNKFDNNKGNKNRGNDNKFNKDNGKKNKGNGNKNRGNNNIKKNDNKNKGNGNSNKSRDNGNKNRGSKNNKHKGKK